MTGLEFIQLLSLIFAKYPMARVVPDREMLVIIDSGKSRFYSIQHWELDEQSPQNVFLALSELWDKSELWNKT